jgi:hypothetical protein
VNRKACIACPLFMIALFALLAWGVVRLRRLERRVGTLGDGWPDAGS